MVTLATSTLAVPELTTRRCGVSWLADAPVLLPAKYWALRAVTGVGVGTVSVCLIALSGVSLLALTVVQSSARMPPVSPESGFQDQNVQLKLLAPLAEVEPR